MRPPNFKLDWFIPNQIAALTHFHSDVTSDDFMGVVQTGQTLLADVRNPFHVIIDNRVINMPAPVSLSQMKQMVSYMNHPFLRWVVVVKPESLSLDTATLPIETQGETHLKNVASLSEAIQFLKTQDNTLQWQQANTTFFPNITLG